MNLNIENISIKHIPNCVGCLLCDCTNNNCNICVRRNFSKNCLPFLDFKESNINVLHLLTFKMPIFNII